MSWTDLLFIIGLCGLIYRLRALVISRVLRIIGLCLVYFYLWVFEPVFEFIFFGMLHLLGYYSGWRYMVVPRFQRLRDKLTLRWHKIRAPRREDWRTLREPSRAQRFLYTVMLMSYDEVITYTDTTTAYRSGKPITSIIHRASPLERIFGVGLWPFT